MGLASSSRYLSVISHLERAGICAAHRAGMKPVMVPDLVPPDAEMEQLAHIICRDLRELQAYYLKLI